MKKLGLSPIYFLLVVGIVTSLVLSACQTQTVSFPIIRSTQAQTTVPSVPELTLTSVAPRPSYAPGELVDYTVQSGDNLPALASHFNTTEEEIRAANPVIPERITILPHGLPLKIPIYYRALWGSSFQIIPDNAFVNGPRQVGFDAVTFVQQQPGWLKNHSEYAGNQWLTGGEIVNHLSEMYSISPQLLLAIIEYQTHALTQPIEGDLGDFPFDYQEDYHKGFYLQLVWVANTLNNGYYGWRTGRLTTFNRLDGTLENYDPWQNAATVALHYFYAQVMGGKDYEKAILGEGLIQTYKSLFGDPWLDTTPLMEGSIEQPPMRFPFSIGETWTFTSGPHTGWGEGDPWAAVDFAPPVLESGCQNTEYFATAVANGVIARSDPAEVLLDLGGDGDERTGWVVYYLHVASQDRIAAGTKVKAGDPIGHPSCEGGEATGTHIHIARKYNGEWVAADGPLAFNLEGWIVKNGDYARAGTMQKFDLTVTACTCSNAASRVTSVGFTP
jgi:murein DD-endopeptidase MepM/ murein hydrolase activator NlpD